MKKRIHKIYKEFDFILSASGHYRLIVILICAVILAGAGLTWWTGARAGRELRREFLITARIVAEAVNPDRVASLHGAAYDSFSQDYQRLKEQLWLVRKVMPQFGIFYILGVRKNGIFLYVDSESQGSSVMNSRPEYFDSWKKDACIAVFESGKAVLIGPYGSKNGEEWITAIVPLYQSYKSEPIALFCIDMDSREWSQTILGHIAAPVLFTVFITIALSCYLLFYRYYEESMKRIFVSEEYTKLAIDGAGLGTWEWDVRTGKISANDRFVDMFGYARNELIMKLNRWRQIVHADDAESIQKLIDTNFSDTDVSFDIEHRIKHASGEWIWVINRGRVLERTVTGEPLRIAGTIMDISDRRRSEHALMESMERFRRIFNESPIGIEIFDSSGSLTDANRVCLDLLGVRNWEQFKGISVYDDPNFKASLLDSIREGDIKGLEVEYDFDVIKRTGHYESLRNGKAVFDVTISTLVFEDDSPRIEFIVHIQDITDKKNAEKEKIEFEKRFQTAQRMESLGLLAGGVAHDFNNILGALQGFAEMTLEIVEEQLLESPALEYIRNVILASNRASDLVDQILTFSRKTDSVRKPLDIAVIVKEAAKMIKASMPSDIQVNISISQKCGRVLADPVHIHQVIMNLCSNARHAMAESGGILSIELSRSAFGEKGIPDHDGEYVRLVISDTGCGIPSENIGRIFDPFFTTKKPGEGTGLGLSVIHGIVVSCDGAVMVESIPGKGSSFYVYLPDAAGREEATSVISGSTLVSGDRKIRVILVDDEKPLLGWIKEKLAAKGFEVSAFSEPLEALEVLRHNPSGFDVFITDFWMPGIKGTDVLAAAHECRADLPVILMVGHEADTENGYPYVQGNGCVIRKPLLFNEFFNLIKRLLEPEN